MNPSLVPIILVLPGVETFRASFLSPVYQTAYRKLLFQTNRRVEAPPLGPTAWRYTDSRWLNLDLFVSLDPDTLRGAEITAVLVGFTTARQFVNKNNGQEPC